MARTKLHLFSGRVLLGLACTSSLSVVAAAAPATEPARCHMSASGVDDVARALLPARISLPQALGEAAFSGAPTATLSELRYCGPGDKAVGRFRAVVLQDGVAQGQRLLGLADSCKAPLGELAKPAATLVGQGEALVVADVEATAKGWTVVLQAVRTLVVQGGSRRAPAPMPAFIDKRIELATVTPSGLQLDVGSSALYLHLAPVFGERSIDLGVVVAERASDKPTPPVSPTSASVPVDGKATVAIEVPLATVNLILQRLTGSQAYTVPLQGDSVDLRGVSAQGSGSHAGGSLTLKGSATPRSLGEAVDWKLYLTGDPLRVSSIEAAGRLEDCRSLGTLAAMGCDLRNGARVAGAEAFAAALTRRYGGRAAHELMSPLQSGFSVAGRRIRVTADIAGMAVGRHGIVARGSVSVGADD